MTTDSESVWGQPVAIVGYAVSEMSEFAESTEVLLCLDVVTRALASSGLGRKEIDFTCSGSCDYLSGGRSRSSPNLDAVGAWPPIRESHVEMDGAWALYEAWVRLQIGRHRHRARRSAPASSSTGDPAAASTRCRSTRTTWRRSAPTRSRSPRCRPGRCSTPAWSTERRLAEVAAREPGATRRPATPTRGGARATSDADASLAADRTSARRCGATTCRRSPTAPCARACSPRRHRRRRAREHAGLDHRASTTASSRTTRACAT